MRLPRVAVDLSTCPDCSPTEKSRHARRRPATVHRHLDRPPAAGCHRSISGAGPIPDQRGAHRCAEGPTDAPGGRLQWRRGGGPDRRQDRIFQLRHRGSRQEPPGHGRLRLQSCLRRQNFRDDVAGTSRQTGRTRARRSSRQIYHQAAAGRRYPPGDARPAREPHFRPAACAGAGRALAQRKIHFSRFRPLPQFLESRRPTPTGIPMPRWCCCGSRSSAASNCRSRP